MDTREAAILRDHILRNFYSEEDTLRPLTELLQCHSIEEWLLTIAELSELPSGRADIAFMRQMEKISTLLGCTPEDSRKVAVQCFADMSTGNFPDQDSNLGGTS